MPALVAGIHALKARFEDVGGRNKSGHAEPSVSVCTRTADGGE
jgi:hypothetical protein